MFLGDVGKREEANLAFAPELQTAFDPLRRREGIYRADHSVARGMRIGGVNLVVGSLRRKAFHAHAEHRIGMDRVQPDVRFCGLAQILRILAVVYNPKVLGRATRVVGGPPDNGQTFCSRFELWSLEDADVRGFLGSRNELSGRLDWKGASCRP